MKTLPKHILMTLLSLTSLSASAAEVWVRAGGRLFRADVRADEAELAKSSGGDLTELLRGAELREVALPALQRGEKPTWTEPKCPATQRPASETAPDIRPMAWTETQNHLGTWTEVRK